MCSKVELTVAMQKAFNQPASKKTGAAGDEDLLAAHLVPEAACGLKNVIEIRLRDGSRWHWVSAAIQIDALK